MKLKLFDETKKRAHESQIARDEENLKLSYGGPRQRQTSCTNQPIIALRQGHYWVWSLTHRRAIKEETKT